MIAYLKGKILSREGHQLILSVGEGATCLGYEVNVLTNPLTEENYFKGKLIELFIYSHIREDAFDLYGFEGLEERRFFKLLIGVSGIGPKAALNVMIHRDLGSLVRAILEQDKTVLLGIKGIGKKIAERVLIELKEPLNKQVSQGKILIHSPSLSSGPDRIKSEDKQYLEALEALKSLGYRENDVRNMLKELVQSSADQISAEELIRQALQQLA